MALWRMTSKLAVKITNDSCVQKCLSLLEKHAKSEVNDEDDKSNELLISTSDRKKFKKKKRKEDKEGLINPGFEDEHKRSQHIGRDDVNPDQLRTLKESPSCVIELLPANETLTSNARDLSDNEGRKPALKAEVDDGKSEKLKTRRKVKGERRKLKNKKEPEESNAKAVELSTDNSPNVQVEDEKLIRRKRREKRRQKRKSEKLGNEISEDVATETSLVEASETLAEQATKESASDLEGNWKILCVKIHRVDRLKMTLFIKHPVVRVHIVDGRTGNCLKRSTKGKTMDSRSSNSDFILPSMTHPFDLKQKRSFIPTWDEPLLFHECFDYITGQSDNLIFFEILDFLPMSVAGNQYKKLEQESGWYHVAWGFLKILGSSGVLNVDRQLQLQLYYPPKQRIRPEPKVVPVFQWWKTMACSPYPGTLFVTVCAEVLPQDTHFGAPSLTAIHREMSETIPDQPNASSTSAVNEEVRPSPSKSTPRWSRLPGQSCKVPNTPSMRLGTVGKGCYTASFSRDGRLIACGCFQDNSSVILIYDVFTGKLLDQCQGHSGLIYEISFSCKDSWMISASGDSSARVWSINDGHVASLLVLPHPSYVYCSRFHPTETSVAVTGCFDHLIRVWDINNTSSATQGHLIQELEHHEGHVNAICFDKDGKQLFSGDSCGVVCQWIAGDTTSEWSLCHEIRKSELQGVAINQLLIHPTSNQLLIQSRDSSIRLMDLNSLTFAHHFKGFLNICEKVHCCITPCGNYVITGSEDHQVYVWNAVTDDQVGIYSDLPFHNTVHCVVYHPFDHILVMCCYGSNVPVVIYKYDLKGISYVKSISDRIPSPKGRHVTALASVPVGLLTSERRFKTSNLTEIDSSNCLEKIIQKLDSVLDVSSLSGLAKLGSIATSWRTNIDAPNLNSEADVIYQVVAERDYTPLRSDELRFTKGDIIDILVTENDSWWIGRLLNGQRGYIPVQCVSIIDSSTDKNKYIDALDDAFDRIEETSP